MALTPGLQIPFGIQPVNPVPVDAWSGPYTGSLGNDNEAGAKAAANSSIPSAIRFQSMEVRLVFGGVAYKYWYRNGIDDADLVLFSSEGAGGGSGGATYFNSETVDSIFATGALALRGNENIDSPRDKGTDVFFYVSGSIGGNDKSLFSGDVITSGSFLATQGLSGSLTKLLDGTSFIIAGDNVVITSASNGSITISSLASGGGGASDANATFLVLSATGSLNAERIFAPGTGIITTDGGAGGNYTVSINNSIVATVSGATFTGVTKHNSGLSGSLTKLVDGTSAFVASTGILISSSSNGAVTFVMSNTGSAGTYGSTSQVPVFTTDAQGRVSSVTNTSIQISESQVTNLLTDLSSSYSSVANLSSSLAAEKANKTTSISAGLGLTGGGNLSADRTLAINDSIVATISGSTFTGAAKFNAGLSGSLTKLSNGVSYLIAGDNITIASASNGSITIASTASGTGGGGDSAASYLVLSATGSLSNERVLTAGVGINYVDDGAGNNYTISINNNVVATVSGTTFTGVTKHNAGLSGSLTKLIDGTSAFIGSTGILITSASNSAVTFTLSNTGSAGTYGSTSQIPVFSTDAQGRVTSVTNSSIQIDESQVTNLLADLSSSYSSIANLSSSLASEKADKIVSISAGLGLVGGGNLSANRTLSINDSIVATISGSTFTGASRFNAGLSGSLTKLVDGSSYLVAGDNVTITSASNGQITISSTGGSGFGDANATYLVMSTTGSLAAERVLTAGTGLILTDGGANGNATLAINDSIVAATSGATFTGPVNFNQGLSGSLTKLANGTSYLIAGSNVTITSASNGSITISASVSGSGGSITVTSGSTSISSTTAIKFGSGFTLSEESTGIAAVSASIGEPEDGIYSDGIFTDFTPSTPIGIAIDRFNELFLSLAPSPAPDLDNVDCDTTAGITAFLSFGTSNDLSFSSPAYISSNTTAGFSAVDVNGSYSAATLGSNIRKGIYNGASSIIGDLNEDVPAYVHNSGVTNYVANAFGNANQGSLELYVNGTLVHTVDLTTSSAGTGVPGSGTASKLNASGSGFINLSQTGSAVQSNNLPFTPFQHRTGRYTINPNDQRNGWNYARVIHNRGASQTQTNYVEWINDNNTDALTANNNSLNFEGSGSIHLSGVEYFQSGTLTYLAKVNNAYNFIYDTTAISFTASNSAAASSGLSVSFANQAKPTILGGENHTKSLHLTASTTLTANYFTSGSITVGTTVTHPLKTNLTNGGQATTTGILTYNYSNTSTETAETFRRENYRILSGSYNTQADVVDSGNVWNSTAFMTSSNGGHSDGLQFFNTTLVSPKNTTNGGNFSTFNGGPSENPNYSGISGVRTFYRWFKNTSGAQHDLSLSMNGSSTIVSNSIAFNSTRIKVFIKIPGKTGWMDVALPYTLDQAQDGSGAHIVNAYLSFDNTLNAINYLNFGNLSIDNNEYVVLKILADSVWTGNVSSITVDFGAGTGTLTPVPDLDDIDSDNTGTTARLSFGSSKSISGYDDPTSSAGFAAADLNDVYQVAEVSNNLRRAVFTGTTIMQGDLNADVVSPGADYTTYAFSDANSGSLKLEVNGSIIHEVEITGSVSLVGVGSPGAGTGTSVNANGSGFVSLSQWGPGLFDNGVPRFSEIQRTAKYKVTTTDQRTGWNYLRVIHTINGTDRTTNYVEWINDPNANALSSAGNELSIFGDDAFSYISGVKYFTSPSGSIRTRISNIYKNVYSNSNTAISFASLSNATASRIIQSGSGLSSTKTTNATTDSLQTLNINLNSQDELLHVSGTINFNIAKSLPGTYTTTYGCGGAMIFVHPLKSNLTLATQSTTNLLVWSPTDTSNANTDEYFTGETYRLVSGSYSSQSDITNGSYTWNSTIDMNDQMNFPTYATGLLIYDTYLLAPKDGGVNGDFRNHKESGSIESPAGNVNYSSLTNSTRQYYRSFLNNTVNDRPSVQVTLYGDATIVGKTGPNAAALGTNKNIFVEISIPGKTSLLDLGKPSAGAGNFNEGDGCLSGDLNQTVDVDGVTNTCTFNGATVDGTVSGAEYIIIKISASDGWTGYLDRLSISWS